MDGSDVAALAARIGADLVVVGPEAPLVAGVADAVRLQGISCYGPSRAAAQLEGSKTFSKQVMAAADVGEQVLSMLTLSAGIAQAPEHGTTAAELLRAADNALYAAKHAGRDRIVVYEAPSP